MRKYLIQMLNKILKEKQITIQSMTNEIKKVYFGHTYHVCMYVYVRASLYCVELRATFEFASRSHVYTYTF